MPFRKALALLGSAMLVVSLAAATAPPAQADVFPVSNTAPIGFPNTGPTNANPYPSTITQYGMGTAIADVNVVLNGVSHTFPDDLDIEVVAPDGTAVVLMSDACGDPDLVANTFTFDDQAALQMPDAPADPCASGAYQPTNYAATGETETWPVAPTGPALSALNGHNPNGQWRLFVRDDSGGDTGLISGGWGLQITTAATPVLTIPTGSTSNGVGLAGPYPLSFTVSGYSGLVTDLNVTLPGLTHSNPDDIDALLVGPTGANAVLMSDACGSAHVLNVNLTFDDQAAAAIPDAGPCPSGSYRPADYPTTGESYGAPAPSGAHGTSLAVFNGTDPNGVWTLYVVDDAGGEAGWLASRPTLNLTMNDSTPPQTKIKKAPRSGTKRRAKVTFVASEAGATFQCKLDKKPWVTCTSPVKLKHLRFGRHTLRVRAVDAAGNFDATPAKASWRVHRRR